ncbi:MAG: IS21 family transposase [Acidobacteria bacterium]|nr:IS21 family transposase [Acidobacteriota bacterium]MCA1628281.1 IS21 family transposase [Acidobacteriota bacterium]
MLKMDHVQVIRHKVYNEGHSVRRVAREMKLRRRTIAKYLGMSAPVRTESKPRPCPTRERAEQRIAELLAQWRERTTRKQRITGSRLHRQLVEEGIEVGKTTVYEVMRERRRQVQEVFVPLVHRAGDAAQVDFFEVTVDVAGVRQHAWKFVMRLMYSGHDFVWLYEQCDQLSFLDAHVRAFAYFTGVPARCIYDNLTAAVHRKVGAWGCERKLTERFAALSSHYLFEPCFARPGEGHDKGGVEARGKGVRLQHLTPIPDGRSLSELADAVLQDVARAAVTKRNPVGESVAERFAAEQANLRALPDHPFDARKLRLLSVSRQATVQIDGARYSVPSRWAGLPLTAFIGVTDIRLVCRDEAEVHPRLARGARSIRYRHYLPELARKPQAVRQVAPELVAELGAPYGELWSLLVAAHGGLEAARTLARLLAVVNRDGEEAVSRTLARFLEAAPLSAVVDQPPLAALVQEVAVPAALRGYSVEAGRASDYDWLLSIDGGELAGELRAVQGGVQ